MKIVFMGTPDFAAASLSALIGHGHEIACVLTKADRPQGRGMKLTPSPVKQLAITHEIPCLQPETLKDDVCFEMVSGMRPDIIVVVAYGLFLPTRFLELPKLACINVHGSLLPKYRGAAPIQWAIINGETRTGVCTMHMKRAMDAGDVISSKGVDISENDTFGMVYDMLKVMGSELLLETIDMLCAGNAPRIPQDESLVTFAPAIKKDDVRIDWTKPARSVHNLIRGAQPVPCATSGALRIHSSLLTGESCDGVPGAVVRTDETGIHVCCGDGFVLCITRIQAPGKPKTDAAAFVRGHGTPQFN